MQISEVSLKVCRIGLPRQPVHPGGGVALEHEVRLPEQIDAEVVEERGELLLPPLLSCLPYASERLGHTSPTLCPVCTAQGRCGSLLLHRKGLAPSTSCRSPGALRNPSQQATLSALFDHLVVV